MDADRAGFGRLITALEPWLEQVVIVGGWAHRLYHLHPSAQALEFEPLMTFDADVALSGRVPRQQPTIRDLLVAAGFHEDFRGDDKPPATHYRLRDHASGFYAEFLTPLTGGELTREGKRKATAHVAGVNSQQLRFIDLLIEDPWQVSLEAGAFGLAGTKAVQVANPAAFVAQKLLIHKKRDAADRAKDILYMHDTLQVFGSQLDQLHREWTERIRPRLSAKDAKVVSTAADWLFGEVTDTIRDAAEIAGDREMSPYQVQEGCRYGLQVMLGATGGRARHA
jgi:hypothetical protein